LGKAESLVICIHYVESLALQEAIPHDNDT